MGNVHTNKAASPYSFNIKVKQDELTPKDIEKRITDFQKVFVNVASRYINEQMKGEQS